MNLNNRLAKLEARADELPTRRTGPPIPTESLCAFVRGWLRGEFAADEVDRTNSHETTLLYELSTALIALGPKHQEWCDATGWGRKQHDEWERGALGGLSADELAALKRIAEEFNPTTA